MSLLSEKVATVLQGQVLTVNSITSNNIATDVLVASEVACTNVEVSGNVSVEGVVSAPSFLSLHQSQAFPENTYDDTTITGLSDSANKWFGGVLAPNGKIYGIPYTSPSVLIIDPVTNTTDTTTITGLSSSVDKWFGGVVAPNGKIYGTPYTSSSVLIIDPVTNTADTTTITGLSTGTFKWIGGVLGPDGKIYGNANLNTNVLILDPSSPVVDITTSFGINVANVSYTNVSKLLTFGAGATLLTSGLLAGDNIIITVSGGIKYTGYIQSIDSNTQITFIYALSLGADIVAGSITKLEKTRKADFTTLTVTSAQGKAFGGALGPDGKIYTCPLGDFSSAMIIDPMSPVFDISTLYGITIGTTSYTQSSKTLSLPGATATSGLFVGNNIIITTANTKFSALIQTVTDTSITFYDVPYGVDITAGNITKLEKTQKVDITTITGFNGRWLGGFGIAGSVLGPNGKIYGMPRISQSAVILDPSSPVVDITTSFGINVANVSYTNVSKLLTFGAGATLLTSGLLVGDNIIITVTGGIKYTGYIQSIDSNTQITLVYALSLGADIVAGSITKLEKTRKADITTMTGLTVVENKGNGGVLAPNGVIYGFPLNNTYVPRIRTGLPTLPPWMLQAYFNKL